MKYGDVADITQEEIGVGVSRATALGKARRGPRPRLYKAKPVR
jgi:hypothetical protein